MQNSRYRIDHVHVYSHDVDRTVDFYIKTFGATEIRRIGSLVHLDFGSVRLVVSEASDDNPPGIGHFAIGSDGLAIEATKQCLDDVAISGMRVVKSDESDGGRILFQNFFVRDPTSGSIIEIISPFTR